MFDWCSRSNEWIKLTFHVDFKHSFTWQETSARQLSIINVQRTVEFIKKQPKLNLILEFTNLIKFILIVLISEIFPTQ